MKKRARVFLFALPVLVISVLVFAASGTALGSGTASPEEQQPNIVIFLADDLGYGDLSVYGHPTIHTPHLDRMAAEGMKFTQFYVAASVCTPSRAALLTGRLPIRSGMASDDNRVLFPTSKGGLPQEEVTIAEALKEEGYATAAIGKWHLGHRPQYLPTNNGFDSYFGIPYSNDMDRTPEAPKGRVAFQNPKITYWNVPLIRNGEVIQRPANQKTLARRYTEEAVQFIEAHQEDPFFVYLAYSSPHVPLFRSERFEGVSRRGRYGDVVEEIDWSVGRVLQTLRKLNLAENTVVFFTSDNGPWLTFDEQGGSAGLLRGGKGSTWEGGMRVPGIAWWPGTIEAGVVTPAVASSMDLFTTALELASAEVPQDRIIDGLSLLPVLRGETDEGRDVLFYYRGEHLYAVRMGPWKAHFITQAGYGDEPHPHDPPLLFHLGHDPSEKYNVAEEHPDVIEAIRKVVEEHQVRLERGEDQLAVRAEKYRR